MVACDGNCSSFRPSEIALVLLCIFLDAAFRLNKDAKTCGCGSSITAHATRTPAREILKNELAQFVVDLQTQCGVSWDLYLFVCFWDSACVAFQISEDSFHSTREAVNVVLNKYNAQEQTPHRQKLIWRLSSRTASILRPSDRFISVLPAIAEHAPVPSSSRIR